MLSNIHAQHMELTDAIKAHIDENLAQPVGRLVQSPAAKMTVHISADGKEGANVSCHVQVSLPDARDVNVTAEGEDLYPLVDELHDRVLRQVKKELERRADH